MSVRPRPERVGPNRSASRTVLVHLADQRRARTDSHGIINFSLGLVRALPGALADDERLVVLVNDEMVDELGSGFLRDQDELRVVGAPRSMLERLAIDHRAVLRHARGVAADVVLYPKGFLPLGTRRSPAQHVPCLHDDIPARAWSDGALSWRQRIRPGYFTALLRHSMRTADRRLFVSAFTAQQLTARWSGPRPNDVVVHEGLTLPRREVRPVGERERQVIVLGNRLPHKRTAAGLRLLDADPAVRAAVDRVVVVGPLPADVEQTALTLEHRPGPLSGDELADLIATSRLLVYPSAYEGFGLPPIEAYALGTPAVYRVTDASREVLPGVPGGFDDEDPARFADAVEEALALDDERLAAIRAGMWERFDWSVVAARVAVALREDVG